MRASSVARSSSPAPTQVSLDSDEDDFDRHRRLQLEAAESADDGWKAELQSYLNAPHDKSITRDTDTVKWWEVRSA